MTNRYPMYFVFPALIVFTIFFITPTITGFFYSFTDWNIYADKIQFNGLNNYREIFHDPRVLTAFANTLIFAVIVTVCQNGFGLFFALILNEAIYFRNLLRTIFFMPYVIAPIIIGYIFTALYHPDNGLINHFLEVVGLKSLAQDWLNNPKLSLYSIIATDLWRVTGFSMIIYLAGLQFIPKDLFDSANIDGANYWKRFRHIMFPLLAPAFTIN